MEAISSVSRIYLQRTHAGNGRLDLRQSMIVVSPFIYTLCFKHHRPISDVGTILNKRERK